MPLSLTDTIKRSTTALLSFGVSEGMRQSRISTVRALNAMLTVVFIVSVTGSIAGAFRLPTELAMADLVFALIYLIAILLNGVGKHDAARAIGVVAAGLNAFMFLVAFGPGSGQEFNFVGCAFAPIMIFSRTERRKIAAAYAVFIVMFFCAQLYLAIRPALFNISELDLTISRYFVLVTMSAFSVTTVYFYRSAAIAAQMKLHRANERLHELLGNTLPELIAERLDKGETLIADSHAEATVLFADLVGFSEITKRLSPSHLVELLNTIFTQFDEAAGRRGVEKIKTIGDCYMAATGVLGHSSRQVEAMADFALEMLDLVKSIGDECGLPLEIRIGISTGPVISGVIGRRKYAYDLWGDTVNLASRMESGGERGQIQVTESTYWRLRPRYHLEKKGEIDVKGHPNTPVYILLGRNAPADNVLPLDGRAVSAP
jgi:class 3 adenylate cyclase